MVFWWFSSAFISSHGASLGSLSCTYRHAVAIESQLHGLTKASIELATTNKSKNERTKEAKKMHHSISEIHVLKLSRQETPNSVGPLAQDLVSGCFRTACVRILYKISVSRSCGTTCARSLFQDLCVNDPLDHCSRIFWPTVSGSYRPTCARSLYQDRGTICARSLFQDLCVRILWATCIMILHWHLCKISVSSLYKDPFGPLVSGSYRTTCTRSRIRMLSDCLCQEPLGPLVQDLCIRIL